MAHRYRFAYLLVVCVMSAAAFGCRPAAAPAIATQAVSQPRRSIRLAVTVDDLPGSGTLLHDWPKERVLDAIIAALRKHAVPCPVGFFTGSNLDEAAGTKEALDHWIAAGFKLANHTYSHGSAREVGAAAFVEDIAHDERVLRDLLGGRTGRAPYFRYPYLERGSEKDRPLIRDYLAKNGYRVADVTVDFEDWAYAEAYARCSEKRDAKALQDVVDDYQENALAELFWSADTTERILGRSLPQILLVHANVITAQQLDDVLTAYERAGVEFICLDDALKDPVYTEVETDQHGDVTLIEALISERRTGTRSFMPPPTKLLELVCGEETASGAQP